MRDYADACFRYLRATGMVEISQRGHSLSIMPEKKREVEFFLNNIDRKPVFVDDEDEYKKYLFDMDIPALYSDDRDRLIKQVTEVTGKEITTAETTEHLKDILDDAILSIKTEIISKQIADLKEYKEYADVMSTFDDIKTNLKLDDKGQPMSTAAGNMSDIVCDYGDFGLAVEVTMQSGQKQYEMEGEPVSRHLAKLKKETGKDAYCLFVAPKINESCIAYFINMVEQSYKAGYVPNPAQVKGIFDYSLEQAKRASDENEWYAKIKEKALNWL